MSSVCVIVPCYNEARRLPADAFVGYLSKRTDVSFCFVNDGSTDQTQAVLTQLQARCPGQITVLNLPQNAGKAGAVRAGILHCAQTTPAFDYLGYFDADLATPLDAIDDLSAVLDQTPALDLVMGSRIKYLSTDIRRNTFRHYAGRIVATFISNILKLPVYDSQCGAKLFRHRAVVSLFQEPFISPWLFDVELLARLIRQHGRGPVLTRVAERPLRQWTEVDGSRIRPSYYFKLWYELYRIRQTYRSL
ncbi:MAG: glycosyltransferase [Spirosoma sp.]|nr:glycosyltransferase [Spirosoma sp.]